MLLGQNVDHVSIPESVAKGDVARKCRFGFFGVEAVKMEYLAHAWLLLWSVVVVVVDTDSDYHNMTMDNSDFVKVARQDVFLILSLSLSLCSFVGLWVFQIKRTLFVVSSGEGRVCFRLALLSARSKKKGKCRVAEGDGAF